MLERLAAPGDHERLPLTPEELARRRRGGGGRRGRAARAPARPDGRGSLEPEHCTAAVRALREAAPGLELSLSIGLWITGGDVERRLECIRGWTELPDCVSRDREARIGPEDTYWLPDARRAGSNAELVAAAAERYLRPSG